MRILSSSNLKLGGAVASWSIPAFITCPGATTTCLRDCYALTKRFKKGPVFDAHLKNLEFTKTDLFVPAMVDQIKTHSYKVVRIHVAGDFYSPGYVEKWARIAAETRRFTTFFFYTRSWRQPDILPELLALGSLDNVEPWWSVDMGTGRPPMIPGFRSAYMAVDDWDAANAPDTCDLVFRNDPKTVMKKANGVQVCPTEQGIQKLEERITCTNCGICWRTDRRKLAEFLFHNTQEATELFAP